MIDIYIETILKMISNRNTSYKLFLMKYLIKNISGDKTLFSFKELSCGMVSESWQHYEYNYFRYTKNDRIFDLIQYAIESSSQITIYSSNKQVFDFLWNSDDKNIIRMLKRLTSVVQYRLLVPFIDSIELTGLKWNKQNKYIKEKSKIIDMFYTINEDSILVNSDWVKYICLNREIIIKTVEGIIDDEYRKKNNGICR